MEGHAGIAHRLFAAVMAGDVDAVRALYAPDAVVWHNFDDVEQPVEENLRVLLWVSRHIADLRYEDVRCQETATGFVQQHVLRGTTPDGRPVSVAACMVGRVEGGRITRLDEYLDSAHLAPLLGS